MSVRPNPQFFLEATAGVPIAWRKPFDLGAAYVDQRPAGESLLEMVQSVPDLPPRFWLFGVVCINGVAVDRAYWRVTRPKPTSIERPIAVTMHLPPAGGGSGSSSTVKSVVALVAAVALTVATAGISNALIPIIGAIGAHVVAGAVGIAGALAISALTAPPAVKNKAQDDSDQAKEASSASGNLVSPGGAISRVIGTRRVFPALPCEPLTELIDDDEYVEFVGVLNGPHALTDFRIGEASIDTVDDVETEILEGWPDDPPLELVTRQGRTETPQIQLSNHLVDSINSDQLQDPASPQDDLPVWHSAASRSTPDEIWMHLLLAQGLIKASDNMVDQALPIRIRIKRRGDPTWINLPEVHLSGKTTQQLRREFRIKWTDDEPEVVPSVPTADGFVYASIAVPAQVLAPGGGSWAAHSYFVGASGSSGLYNGVESATKVRHTYIYANRVEFYLDRATFGAGVYDIQIKRGAVYKLSDFTPSNYQLVGVTWDLFGYQGTTQPSIPYKRANIADSVILGRVCTVWNEPPVPKAGFAVVAVRARNRALPSVSVLASGYVRDWDGTGWNNWTTTSNPAPHYRDVLSGSLNLDPLPVGLVDGDGLVDWRQECADNGWDCDTIIEDERTQDVLGLIASCGYARPYQSELYGVTVDRDTSAESPIQIFSAANSDGFRFEKAFARLPNGFIVNYRDQANDYAQAQVYVYARDYDGGDDGLFETVTYEGIVDRAKVVTRAQFDLDQVVDRSTFYYLNTDIEAIVCRRGDLVGINVDVLDRRFGSALIKTVNQSSGNIVSLLLESQLSIVNELDMHHVADMPAVADMHDVGIQTGVAIRRRDGTTTVHPLSTATGFTNLLTLTTPIAATSTIKGLDDTDQTYGCLAVVGAVGSEYRRLLVSAIAPDQDFRFGLTLVDEAQNLVRVAA
jgi:hypothetical protein